MQPTLIFPETWQLDGFTTNVTSRQAGEADPVIRELLQNCLDAALREAHRPRAEVHFTIARRSLQDLPGVSEYGRAFKAAKNEVKEPTTNDVRQAVKRIEDVLASREMNVLFCRDNGIGLDQNRMKALVSEGQSDKATRGAGSYGLGHLTAYAASDLRYVLYAGRQQGNVVASGHAILASHVRSGTRHSAHGFWRAPTDVFSLEDGNFPTQIPDLLHDEMSRIADSGSVVAIAGFNYFHEEKPSAALDDICRVAALNFMGAIWEDKMVVSVHDEITGQSARVDCHTLETILLPVSKQQRAPAKGWLAGSQGYRALQTLQTGRRLDNPVDRSVQVHFRPLEGDSRERSRVQVFRDGMWITNSAPRLDTSAFGGVLGFDAVVMLSDADPENHTEFYDLIRNSEGPEHRDLTKLRELERSDKKLLDGMLNCLAEQLRAEAGALSSESGFTPTGFAVFDGDVQRVAERIPRFRQRSRGTRKSSGLEGGSAPGQRSRERTRRDRVTSSAVAFRSSVRPRLDESGGTSTVIGQVLLDEKLTSNEELYLRVYVESGSDASCEQPLRNQQVPIAHATINGVAVGRGGQEIAVPQIIDGQVVEFEVALGRPVTDPGLVRIELVSRSTQSSHRQEVAQ